MTTYYIDFDNGDDSNTGTSASSAWKTLNKYMGSTRSAGDKAIIRRGTTETASQVIYVNGSGQYANPIIVEADYNDAWGDFSNSSQTYSVSVGSTTMTASATITDISAGDWIYVVGDDSREDAYEVKSVSGTTLELYLPYTGSNAGTGKTLKIMGPAPYWNDTKGSYYLYFYSDVWWILDGIKLGFSNYGVYDYKSNVSCQRCILEGTGSGIGVYALYTAFDVYRCRFKSCNKGVYGSSSRGYITDCYFDGGGSSGNYLYYASADPVCCKIENATLVNSGSLNYSLSARVNAINTSNGGSYHYSTSMTGELWTQQAGPSGINARYSSSDSTSLTPAIQTDTSITRTGGADYSLKITPGNYNQRRKNVGRLLIMEIPISLTTTSTTYSVYVKTDNTSNWTTSPTSSELFLEISDYASSSVDWFKRTKSTTSVNFTSSTDWQQISVSSTSAQTGTGYLRLYYCKPKESGKSNIFYVDAKPVIS